MDRGFSSCSNCKKWKKECTFNWLSSKRLDSSARRNTKQKTANVTSSSAIPPIANPHDAVLEEALCFSQWYPNISGSSPGTSHFDALSSCSSSSLPEESAAVDDSGETEPFIGRSNSFSRNMGTPDNSQTCTVTRQPKPPFKGHESQVDFYESPPRCLNNTYDVVRQREQPPPSLDFEASRNRGSGHKCSTTPDHDGRSKFASRRDFCQASGKTAHEFARLTMTQNLIRIYHDSMENALSCWLTEHNCPYSDSGNDMLSYGERMEWGPNWSNRICIRVCRLDRASSSIRGRALSKEEDKTAARALHLAIMAFASQWTQHAEKGTTSSVPAQVADDERSIRENIWNKARHDLEHSAMIPSFRIIFANIIFSLTQRPLDTGEDKRLCQLLENDNAPMFLEAANRQLFTFRHKFTRLQREASSYMGEHRRGSIGSTMTDMFDMPKHSEPPHIDPILANNEHRSTLGLLFWLGVMFDTLSSAMYQRPLVVSDEDSQIASASVSMLHSEYQVDLDGWNVSEVGLRKKEDVWGDFFLRRPADCGVLGQDLPRWPCSYEQAAAVLSEATPVKVLLYRRITQLQTLVYRGESQKCLEEVIKKTIQVYRYWNCTYRKFMLDCVNNHELLPPRIQSWYVILDCHWHLAALLLADVIENIDHGRLGSATERLARQAGNFVSTLRMDNAFAVGALARSSIHGQGSTASLFFHDSLNEVAFLVEPWTVVLIHSFAKAGYICLESLGMPDGKQSLLTERVWQTCDLCITALRYIGRKSDMAFLVAQNISRSLYALLHQI